MKKEKVYEIRWHGRGGQGTVTAANVVSQTAFNEGYLGVQSIPLIGAERRGSALAVFSRLSKKPINLISQIYNPDIIVCIDPSLFKKNKEEVTAGIKDKGTLIVNSTKDPEDIDVDSKNIKVCSVDASGISVDLELYFGGSVVVNSPMLGAFSKGSGLIKLDSLINVIKSKWKGKWGEKNCEAIERAYKELKIKEAL
ncbi:MAG: pyruvate ferredoxin oxidoreductase [Candidatus Lokiarchaeota archaeon]|nr:pyruvate ferredoxin oxidoreductase [Candidatus Lokiarchaeota archaeon]